MSTLPEAPTVLFFDIDGTLIRTGGATRAAMARALKALFGIEAATVDVDTVGRTDRAIICDLLELYGIDPEPATLEEFFRTYCALLPETLAARRRGRVLPGVRETLEQFSQRPNTVLALLTGNLRRGAYAKLAHFGLAHYFPCGGFGDHHLDRRDVAREAVEAIRRHLAVEPDPARCYVIGDTVHDIRCAHAIGAVPIAVLTGWTSAAELYAEQPYAVLETLDELQSILPR